MTTSNLDDDTKTRRFKDSQGLPRIRGGRPQVASAGLWSGSVGLLIQTVVGGVRILGAAVSARNRSGCT